MKRDPDQREKRALEQITDLRDKDVLEIGCGDGRVTAWFAGRANTYIAIDPDCDKLAQAKAAISGAEFRVGSGDCVDVADASFDVVLFTHSLHHQQSGPALQEAHRVLRDSGQVIILEPAVDGETQQFFTLVRDETIALQCALEAIRNSAFTVAHERTITADWFFEDQDELCQYHFGAPAAALEERLIEQVKRRLGAKFHAQPIRMEDKIRLFVLRKCSLLEHSV